MVLNPFSRSSDSCISIFRSVFVNIYTPMSYFTFSSHRLISLFLYCCPSLCSSLLHMCFPELEELLLSLKQVQGCLSDPQSQNDVDLVLSLLHKVISRGILQAEARRRASMFITTLLSRLARETCSYVFGQKTNQGKTVTSSSRSTAQIVSKTSVFLSL